ncbi:MAG: mandelate racemase/muconate lactonizing enzyme family protein [Verrucomicrobiaceae bacterium]|nr:mandelate racemase/muconate lactonizing enzyme family protein [Verrucomicrobiaceae bacterium]
MRTRFPFKYGIASMTALPHVFVNAEMVVDGREVTGVSSEGLPPKWFTKDPLTPFELDLAEMVAVLQNASRIGRLAAERETDFFAWWRDLYAEQRSWAAVRQCAGLLANLGVSMVERAVLDGLCKAAQRPLHALMRAGELRIDLGAVRGELSGMQVTDVIERVPLAVVQARHTIGLGDPLRACEVPEAEKMADGLPHGLDESIRTYGLRFFKIKVCGRPEVDLPRLRQIAAILTEECREGFSATLDGNEQFEDLAAFREFYAVLSAEAALRPLFANLLFIEQPLHRSVALRDDVAALREWRDGPGVIIDESDGSLDDLPRALELGYRGTSHKNCKGVVKGLANAALLKRHAGCVLSGEDLANQGPVALLQDLAVMALLGVRHVERNGHHYFRGLSMFAPEVQAAVLESHAGLYGRHAEGFPVLRIEKGALDLRSVNAAPFGCGFPLSMEGFEPLDGWIKRGGMGEV